jgi:hypothetical protein
MPRAGVCDRRAVAAQGPRCGPPGGVLSQFDGEYVRGPSGGIWGTRINEAVPASIRLRGVSNEGKQKSGRKPFPLRRRSPELNRGSRTAIFLISEPLRHYTIDHDVMVLVHRDTPRRRGNPLEPSSR